MYKYTHYTTAVLLLVLVVSTAASEVAEARTGTIQLDGGNSNDLFFNAAIIIPILIAIIVLDFAIFGTFASRSDTLNPVSRFFYHAREGLSIVRERNSNRFRRKYQYPPRQRVARSLEMFGPVVEALSKAKEKYE